MSAAPIHAPQSRRAELQGGRDPAQDSAKEAIQKVVTTGRPEVAWKYLGSSNCSQHIGGCSEPSGGPSRPRAPSLSDNSNRDLGGTWLPPHCPGGPAGDPQRTHAPTLLTHPLPHPASTPQGWPGSLRGGHPEPLPPRWPAPPEDPSPRAAQGLCAPHLSTDAPPRIQRPCFPNTPSLRNPCLPACTTEHSALYLGAGALRGSQARPAGIQASRTKGTGAQCCRLMAWDRAKVGVGSGGPQGAWGMPPSNSGLPPGPGLTRWESRPQEQRSVKTPSVWPPRAPLLASCPNLRIPGESPVNLELGLPSPTRHPHRLAPARNLLRVGLLELSPGPRRTLRLPEATARHRPAG